MSPDGHAHAYINGTKPSPRFTGNESAVRHAAAGWWGFTPRRPPARRRRRPPRHHTRAPSPRHVVRRSPYFHVRSAPVRAAWKAGRWCVVGEGVVVVWWQWWGVAAAVCKGVCVCVGAGQAGWGMQRSCCLFLSMPRQPHAHTNIGGWHMLPQQDAQEAVTEVKSMSVLVVHQQACRGSKRHRRRKACACAHPCHAHVQQCLSARKGQVGVCGWKEELACSCVCAREGEREEEIRGAAVPSHLPCPRHAPASHQTCPSPGPVCLGRLPLSLSCKNGTRGKFYVHAAVCPEYTCRKSRLPNVLSHSMRITHKEVIV